MHYSPTTNGFYDEATHGKITLLVPDPAWAPSEGQDQAPLIPVANPACLIPGDAVEVSPQQHAALMAAQSEGKVISAGQDGFPVALDPTPPTLVDVRAAAQQRIDAHYQTLYDQAVPNSAMAAEYDAAYMVAKRWLENQTGPVPERVKALAESYDVGNVQAATVVVTKWTEAQAVAFDLRGAARLRAKLAIRQAVDLPGVAAAELAGRASMEAVVYNV